MPSILSISWNFSFFKSFSMKNSFFKIYQQVKSMQRTCNKEKFATFKCLSKYPSTFVIGNHCLQNRPFLSPSAESCQGFWTRTCPDVFPHRPIDFRRTWTSSPPCRARFGQLALCSADFLTSSPELHSCSLSPDSSPYASSSPRNLRKHRFNSILFSLNSTIRNATVLSVLEKF